MLVFLFFKDFPIGLKKPLRRGQPLYKGQMARPQCVLHSEVLLYSLIHPLQENTLFYPQVFTYVAVPDRNRI